MEWLRVVSHPWPSPLQTGWICARVITLHRPVDAIDAICILPENSRWPRMQRCYETRGGSVRRFVELCKMKDAVLGISDLCSGPAQRRFYVSISMWGPCSITAQESLPPTLLCCLLLFDVFKDKGKLLKQSPSKASLRTCLHLSGLRFWARGQSWARRESSEDNETVTNPFLASTRTPEC